MAHSRSRLGNLIGESRANDQDLKQMRGAVWHKQGVIVLRPEDIHDDFLRRLFIGEAERVYGKRSVAL